MIFEDPRWTGARQYFISKIGSDNFTIISGVIITLICPVLSIIQNIIFGLIINIFNYKHFSFAKILDGVQYQTTIISDASRFQVYFGNGKSKTFISRLFGYLFYCIPLVGVLLFYLFFEANSFGCRDMKAPFLFNNADPVFYRCTYFLYRIAARG